MSAPVVVQISAVVEQTPRVTAIVAPPPPATIARPPGQSGSIALPASPSVDVVVAPQTLAARVTLQTPGPKGNTGDQGEQGEQGEQGIQGPPGETVGFDGGMTYIQGVPLAQWTIVHNLGYNPSVNVIDSANEQIYGNVLYPDINTVVLTFASAFSGTAYLV